MRRNKPDGGSRESNERQHCRKTGNLFRLDPGHLMTSNSETFFFIDVKPPTSVMFPLPLGCLGAVTSLSRAFPATSASETLAALSAEAKALEAAGHAPSDA